MPKKGKPKKHRNISQNQKPNNEEIVIPDRDIVLEIVHPILPVPKKVEIGENVEGPFVFCESLVERVNSDSIYKFKISYKDVKNFMNNLRHDSYTIAGFYGDHKRSEIAISEYFHGSRLNSSNIKEGIIMFYQHSTQKIALWFVSKDTFLLSRPMPRSSRATFIVKILSDLCPIVFYNISLHDTISWSFESPEFEKKHEQFKIKFEEKVIEEYKSTKANEIGVYNDDKMYISSDNDSFITSYDFARIDMNAVTNCLKELAQRLFDEMQQDDDILLSLIERTFLEKKESVFKVEINYQNIIPEIKKKFGQLRELPLELKKNYIKFLIEELQECVARIKKKSPYLQSIAINKEVKIYKSMYEEIKSNDYNEPKQLAIKLFGQIHSIAKNDFINCIKVFTAKFIKASEEKSEKLKDQIYKMLVSLIKSLGEYVLITKQQSIQIEDNMSRVSLSEPLTLINIKISTLNLNFTQLIELAAKKFYLLISCSDENYCQLYCIEKNDRVESKQLESIDDADSIISWGSTESKLFIVKNTQGLILLCSTDSVGDLEKFKQIYTFEESLNRIEQIFYMKKHEKLLILTNSSELKMLSLISSSPKLEAIEELPQNNRYENVKVSADELSIILQKNSEIHIYNIIFDLLEIIKIEEEISDIKHLIYENSLLLLVKCKQVYKTFFANIPQKTSIAIRSKRNQQHSQGNPGIDIWQYMHNKFGNPTINTLGFENQFLGFTLLDHSFMQHILEYSSKFKNLKNKIFKGPVSSSLEGITVKKHNFQRLLDSRIPVHLAMLDKGSLIPLQNGENNLNEFTKNLPENHNILYEYYYNYIKLGGLEQALLTLDKISVIAIIGKQSSGKSYFCNRVFGSRFDVSAQRCTQGVWASLAFIQNHPFFILDCEGLFSNERSGNEEIKMCLLVTALADILFCNSGLNSDRALVELFDNYIANSDSLEGTNLFKGKLKVLMKDIPDGSEDDADKEFSSMLGKMFEKSEMQLIKVFNGSINSINLSHFEAPDFEEQIESIRDELVQLEPRFSGKDLIDTIKSCLIKICFDCQETATGITQKVSLDNCKILLLKLMTNNLAENEHLEPESYMFEFTTPEGKFKIDFNLWSPTCENGKMIENLKYNFENKFNKMPLKKYHNEIYRQFENFLAEFYSIRTNSIRDRIIRTYKGLKLDQKIFQNQIKELERELTAFQHRLSLCLKKCSACSYLCTLSRDHLSGCSCLTDHRCGFICNFCEEKCSLEGGHNSKDEYHICDSPQHRCKNKCSVDGCNNLCQNNPNHTIECLCSKSSHECEEKCPLFEICKGMCSIDKKFEHIHTCSMSRCPFSCQLCDNLCANSNHLHAIKGDQIDLNEKHLCNSAHQCKKLCELNAVCGLDFVQTINKFKNEKSDFDYIYLKQITTIYQCCEEIPSGHFSHQGKHFCSVSRKNHFCKAQCPDCSAFCSKPPNHAGLHATNNHRNKENCVYLSNKANHVRVIEDYEAKPTTATISRGDTPLPEHCGSSCMLGGRGHPHPIKCPGGEDCYELLHAGYARHSNSSLLENGVSVRKQFDLIECRTYWRIYGWEAPVETNNPDAQNVLSQCSCVCAHESHASEKYFCNDHAFHTKSEAYSNHSFKCKHVDIKHHDIIFIIDITESMEPYRETVIDLTTLLLTKWGDYGTKFAIVAYTDHGKDRGRLQDGDNPYIICPSSKRIDDFDLNDLQHFVNEMPFSGGGGNDGEAMIDGMNAASKLDFRKDSRPIYIIMADDKPHGEEFGRSRFYPNGCPCNLSWKNILKEMKLQESTIIFVRFDTDGVEEVLTETIKNFKGEFNNNFLEVKILSGQTVHLEIEKYASAVIQPDLEYSMIYRPDD